MKHPQIKFNMSGYLIEFNQKNNAWTWMKWEYDEGFGRKRHVVRKSGSIEFMKMSPSIFNKPSDGAIRSQEEMYRNLDKYGMSFIFLFQGQTLEEKGFDTIEEAVKFHKLDTYPSWNLTGYWFSFDNRTQSWGMYDTFTGKLEFTPQSAFERMPFSQFQPSYMKAGVNRRTMEHTYH
jgi:hypothetical protein